MVNGRENILLNDIQHLFGLREYFALAILASWGELDHDFVDSSPSPLDVLDTKGDDFLDKNEAAQLCMEMIEEYEGLGITTEEEFQITQAKLGISEMGFEGHSCESSTSIVDEKKSSIDIFSEPLYELDECPQEDIEDID